MKPVTTLGIVFIALFVLKHLIHCSNRHLIISAMPHSESF